MHPVLHRTAALLERLEPYWPELPPTTARWLGAALRAMIGALVVTIAALTVAAVVIYAGIVLIVGVLYVITARPHRGR